jgi:hypothetical protein
VAHFVNVSICFLKGGDRFVPSEVVICETLLVGAISVAWGASFGFEGLGDRGHGRFAHGA